MTEGRDRRAKLRRLQQQWDKIPEETRANFGRALAAHVGRIIEADRPRQEYIEKARSRGNRMAAEIAQGLEDLPSYEGARPETMPIYIEQLKQIHDRRGRREGPTSVGIAYDKAVAEIIRRVDAGDGKQADIINDLAVAMDRPETELESIKTQLRDRVRVERKRRSKPDQMICADSGGA